MASKLALLIVSWDSNDEEKNLQLLEDLRYLNGKTENNMVNPYWEAVEKVIKMDGSGAHQHQHAEKGGLEATITVSYASTVNSLEQLHRATMIQLEDIDKKV